MNINRESERNMLVNIKKDGQIYNLDGTLLTRGGDESAQVEPAVELFGMEMHPVSTTAGVVAYCVDEDTACLLAQALEAARIASTTPDIEPPSNFAGGGRSLMLTGLRVNPSDIDGFNIVAIRALRDATGIGLKPAKDAIYRLRYGNESWWEGQDILPAKPTTIAGPIKESRFLDQLLRLVTHEWV